MDKKYGLARRIGLGLATAGLAVLCNGCAIDNSQENYVYIPELTYSDYMKNFEHMAAQSSKRGVLIDPIPRDVWESRRKAEERGELDSEIYK